MLDENRVLASAARRLRAVGRVGLLALALVGAAEAQITALAPVETVLDGGNELVGVVVASDGTRYVSDRGAGIVYRIPATVSLPNPPSPAIAGLDRPAGLALDAGGRLLVAEEGAGRILRLEASGPPTVLATGIRTPRWIAVAPDGSSLYITAHRLIPPDGTDTSEGRTILRLRLAPDGTPGGPLATVASGIHQLQALVMAGDHLDAATRGLDTPIGSSGVILRYPVLPDGSLGPPAPLVDAGLKQPMGLTRDVLAAEYLSIKALALDQDTSKWAIGKIHPDEQLTSFAAGLIDPQGLAIGPDGALYLADGKAGRLLKFLVQRPTFTLTAPAFTNQSPLSVTGLTDAGAAVDLFLNGAPAPVTVTADGAFTAQLALTPNSTNILDVFVTPHGGDGLALGPFETTIVHDDIPPALAFQAPPALGNVRLSASVQAQASDSGSSVARLALSVDGVALNGTIAPALPAPSATVTATWLTTSIPDGTHTLGAAATDQATNTTATTRVVIVDNTPPDTQITGGPSGVSQVASATFTFTGTDNLTPPMNLKFAWRLDGGAFTAFSAETTAALTRLSEGAHTFEVKARDLAGNEDLTPAARTFIVDTTPPDTQITGGPSGVIRDPNATFTFTGTDNLTPVVDLQFAWRLDGGAFRPFSPETTAVLTGLAEGPHSFEVKARDLAGNEDPTPAARTFTVTVIGGVPRIVATIDPPFLAPTDVQVSPDGQRAYVVSRDRVIDNKVSVIDTATHSIIATMPAGPGALRGVITSDGARLYVLNRDAVSVTVFDLTTNSVLTTIPLRPTDAAQIAMTPDGGNVLVTHPTAGLVSVIPTATNTVEGEVPVESPTLIVASPDKRHVYVHQSAGNPRDDTISVIDVVARAVVATIHSGRFTGGATFGVFTPPDGGRYYTTDAGDNVIVVDTASHAVLTTISGAFSGPVTAAIHPTAPRLYVGDTSVRPSFEPGVVVIDTERNTVFATLFAEPSRPIGDPTSIVVTPDGQHVIVAANRENTAAVIDAATLATVFVPLNTANPTRAAALPGGRLAYIVGRDSDSLSVLDLATTTVIDAPVSRAGASQTLLVATPAGDKVFGSAGSTNFFLAALDSRTNTPLPNTTIPKPASLFRPVLAAVAIDPVTGGTVYVDDSRKLIHLVDAATSTITGTIAKDTSGMPTTLLVRPDGSRLFSIDSSRIAVIDPATRTELSVTPPPFNPAFSPSIANAARTRLYAGAVLGLGSFAVRVVDLTTLTDPNRLTDPTVPVPFLPSQLALTGDERRLLVVGPSGSIPVIDTATNTLVATLASDGGGYNDIVTSPTAPRAFLAIADGANSRINVIDTDANCVVPSCVVRSIAFSSGAPNFLAISRDGLRLYGVSRSVCSSPSTCVGVITVIDTTVIDTQTSPILVNLTVPVGSNGLQRPIVAPNGRLYVPNRDFDSLIVIE